jgi:hypothetical protein
LVYSGRPDPNWPVDPETARHLIAMLDHLPSISRWPAPRSALGYRGVWLRSSDQHRWVAYDGVVVDEGVTGTEHMARTRRDDARVFERAVLATAPPGLLPSSAAP